MDEEYEYRVIDYMGEDGNWYHVPDGDPEPTTEDLMETPEVCVGFLDADDNWHYRWIDGPFDDDYWIDDAIEETADYYGIDL